MHSNDILKYGHYFWLDALKDVDESHCDDSGVCGVWSVKDIVAHMASQELLLVEILQWVLNNNSPTPMLERYRQMGPGFNDDEVDIRKGKSYSEVMDEYTAAQAKTAELIEQIPLETQRKTGLLAWYGEVYDLEDFLVYTYYAHKREHGAQINVFKDSLKQRAVS